MYNLKFIQPDEIEIVIPLLVELNNKITEDVLKSRLSEMIESGYKCVGVYHKQKLIGISGIWILTKYYVGKHIEPDNVYILPEFQGKGIGKLMIEWILQYGKSIGCVASELNCYTENKSGHKFWEELGYKKIAYHFTKNI